MKIIYNYIRHNTIKTKINQTNKNQHKIRVNSLSKDKQIDNNNNCFKKILMSNSKVTINIHSYNQIIIKYNYYMSRYRNKINMQKDNLNVIIID